MIDGEIAVDIATWIGALDPSRGIRPISEPEPAGRPAVRGHVVAVRADGTRGQPSCSTRPSRQIRVQSVGASGTPWAPAS